MVEPEDIDLEDLVSGGGGEDVSSMTLTDVAKKVATEGVVYIDDKGKMLIKCPEYNWRNGCVICPVYPMPDPDTGGTKQVCGGPCMQIPDSGPAERVSDSPKSSCAYNPDRLGGGSNSDDGSGGLF